MRERTGRITGARADVWLVAVLLAVVALVLLPGVLHGRGVGNDASLVADWPMSSYVVSWLSARIHPANVALCAVRLPPGAREVRFSYRPASVIAGALVSAVAWLAIAGLVLAGALRRRRRRGAATGSP